MAMFNFEWPSESELAKANAETRLKKQEALSKQLGNRPAIDVLGAPRDNGMLSENPYNSSFVNQTGQTQYRLSDLLQGGNTSSDTQSPILSKQIRDSVNAEEMQRVADRERFGNATMEQYTDVAKARAYDAQANAKESTSGVDKYIYFNPQNKQTSEFKQPGYLYVPQSQVAGIIARPSTDPKVASDLRQEFINRPEVKDFMTVNSQINSMDALLKSALAGNMENKTALDQGLIAMFNKLTDPNSVVRESEYARTPENLPVVNRISGAIQKLQAGGAGLTDEDRTALVVGAKIIGNERGNAYQRTRQGYGGLTEKYNLDPSMVTSTLPEFSPYKIDQSTPPPLDIEKITQDVQSKGLKSATAAVNYLKQIYKMDDASANKIVDSLVTK